MKLILWWLAGLPLRCRVRVASRGGLAGNRDGGGCRRPGGVLVVPCWSWGRLGVSGECGAWPGRVGIWRSGPVSVRPMCRVRIHKGQGGWAGSAGGACKRWDGAVQLCWMILSLSVCRSTGSLPGDHCACAAERTSGLSVGPARPAWDGGRHQGPGSPIGVLGEEFPHLRAGGDDRLWLGMVARFVPGASRS